MGRKREKGTYIKSNDTLSKSPINRAVCMRGNEKAANDRTSQRDYTQADGIGYDIEKEFPRLCIRHCKDGETLPISSLNLWNCYRSFMAFKTITSSLSNI